MLTQIKVDGLVIVIFDGDRRHLPVVVVVL